MIKRRAVVTDRPIRLNLYNIEQRLRSVRDRVALILGEIESALEGIEKDRKGQSDDNRVPPEA